MGTIFIRVDASEHIGMGHLMRCMDFANHASGKGVNPVFLTSTSSAKEIIDDKGFECVLIAKNYKHACKEIKSLKNDHSAKVILSDINYCSTIEERREYYDFLQGLKALDFFLITFEDLSSDVFPADIVIIPYVGGESLNFQKKVGSQYLLGTKFFPVREEFRSIIPAVVHVDGTARPQAVSKKYNPRFWDLLDEFEKLTDHPVLINSSFNIQGEPIVCSPSDALRTFGGTGLDVLAIGDFILEK